MLYVKTGVFNLNTPEWIYEDMHNGINLTQIEREKEYFDSLKEKFELPEDYDFNIDEKNVIDELEYESITQCDSCDQIYIGFIKNDDGLYEEDPNAEYSCICGESYGFVTASKYVCYCNKGSPCIPFQGDLETDGNQLCFTLPADVWGDYKPEFMKIIEVSESAKVENKTALCIKHGAIMENL